MRACSSSGERGSQRGSMIPSLNDVQFLV